MSLLLKLLFNAFIYFHQSKTSQPILPSYTPSPVPSPILSQSALIEIPQAHAAPAGLPITLVIPSISVTTDINPVGINENNLVSVPDNTVGWYQSGPIPGQTGIANLSGHFINFDGNPGVFYRLRDLKAGNKITIVDSEGQMLNFMIDSVETVTTQDFPLEKVYGQSSEKRLSIVTCAGKYNSATKQYSYRTIVYAVLTKS